MATHRSRLKRGLIVGAILGTAALPVPAQAHNPSFKGTIEHGTGGLRDGAYSMTLRALAESKCASTTFQGRDWNNFDATVIPAADLTNHSVQVKWKDLGNTANGGQAAVWLILLDGTCARKPVPNQPAQGAHYLKDRAFKMPGAMKWLLLLPEAGVSGVEYTVVAKDPPKPKPKPRRR